MNRQRIRKIVMGVAVSCAAVTFAADLPEGYVPVKYIESTGVDSKSGSGPYIRTGITGNGAVPKVEITYQYVGDLKAVSAGGTIQGYVFGYWSSNNGFGTAIGYDTPSGGGLVGGRYRVASNAIYSGAPDYAWHTVVLNDANGTTIDGKIVDTEAPIRGAKDTGATEYYVFSRCQDGVCGTLVAARVSSLKIWMDGDLKRDYVPACRLSDGAYGLYDLQQGNFATNASKTGMFRGPNSFLSKVTVLKYAEADGQQYIDTGVRVTGGSVPVVRMDYQMTKKTENENRYIFGYWDQPGGAFGTVIGFYNNQHRYRVAGSAYYYGSADTKRHTILMNTSAGTYFGGKLIEKALTGVSDKMNPGFTYYAFARCYDGGGVTGIQPDYAYGRIYSLAIEVDGVCVRDFVPAQRKIDGCVGFYDRLNDYFYPPGPGSKPLKAGPVKSGLCILLY